jgi:hypothetical protein
LQIAKIPQCGGEVVHRAQGVGVIVAKHSPAAG